jgi:hypothetical protein
LISLGCGKKVPKSEIARQPISIGAREMDARSGFVKRVQQCSQRFRRRENEIRLRREKPRSLHGAAPRAMTLIRDDQVYSCFFQLFGRGTDYWHGILR